MRILYRDVAISLAVLSLTGWTPAKSAPVETVLHNFTGYPNDGAYPQAGLIADKKGALYGTTTNGGGNACTDRFGNSFGCGTVFKLTLPTKGQTAWTETVLYNFCSLPNCVDGRFPAAGLIADNQGALYGTTIGGGGLGTVFKLTPPQKGQAAWTETVLYSFCSLLGCSDGGIPLAGLIADKQGALYGTTSSGGSGPYGTVFKLTPPAKGQTAWTDRAL
jgi:uncharacterized repeat protein (TIGR03803 family)